MKKLSLATLLFVFLSTYYVNAQLEMNSAGHIGINTSPTSSYQIEVEGMMRLNTTYADLIVGGGGAYYGLSIHPSANNYCNIGISNKAFREMWCYTLYELSDARQKENIKEIDNALELILKIRGVKYDLKKEFAYNEEFEYTTEELAELDKKRKNKYGFLAQELEEVIPNIANHDDSTDVYGVNYTHLIPILVEAIKEQQIQIEELHSKLKDPKLKITDPDELAVVKAATLLQNTPNPFNENTTIDFYLPPSINQAVFYIYNIQGKQIKSSEIVEC